MLDALNRFPRQQCLLWRAPTALWSIPVMAERIPERSSRVGFQEKMIVHFPGG